MRCTLELNPALCGGLCLLLDVLPLVRPRVGRLHYHSGEKSRSLGGSGLQDTRCTVWQALTTSAERLPDKVAVVDGGERITYSQLVERAGGLASALARLGIVRGDVVAIYMKNSIELVTVFYALQRLGVCVAWVNPDYREHEVRHILDDSGAQTGIVRGDVVAIYMKNSIELVTVFYALQRLGVCVAWVNPDYREHEVRHILDDSGAQTGIVRGDVVASYMKNSIELVTVFYALQRLGVCVAWVNPDYREHEVRHILDDSGAQTVVCFEEWEGFRHLDLVLSLAAGLPRLERVVAATTAPDGSLPSGVIRLQDLLKESGPPSHDDEAGVGADVTPDDTSMLLYTSGTTGPPKGAVSRQWQVVRDG